MVMKAYLLIEPPKIAEVIEGLDKRNGGSVSPLRVSSSGV